MNAETRFARLAVEFPDFPLSDLPEIPAGWDDISWNNDSCPAFDTGKGFAVYVDFADVARREFPECESRFTVQRLDSDGCLTGDSGVALDSWAAVLALVEHGAVWVAVDDGAPDTLAAFAVANCDMDSGELAEIILALARGETVTGGGGAAGDYTVRRAGPGWNDALAAEYETYCKREGLPLVSADEHDFSALTETQRAWIFDFIRRWEAAA